MNEAQSLASESQRLNKLQSSEFNAFPIPFHILESSGGLSRKKKLPPHCHGMVHPPVIIFRKKRWERTVKHPTGMLARGAPKTLASMSPKREKRLHTDDDLNGQWTVMAEASHLDGPKG